MNENDILGFDPTQLKVFNEPEQKQFSGDPLIYRARPQDSKSEDGIYRATIKIIYNPFDFTQSILERQVYNMKDTGGFFNVVSSLTVGDTKTCPVFNAWKKCRYANEGSALNKQQIFFKKQLERFVTIQVLEDENQPELVGKYLFWKLPKSIWEILNAKIRPTDPKKSPIPVMDFLFGRSIDIEVSPGPEDKNQPDRVNRERKYVGELSEDYVSCVNPDGSPLLTDDEMEVLEEYVSNMSKVWKCKDPEQRTELNTEVATLDNTKELKKIYAKVLDHIKEICPNLIEHLGYKPLTGDFANRVNKWCDTVLSGNNPETNVEAPASIDQLDQNKTTSKASEDIPTSPVMNTSMADEDDDLPF